MFEAWFGSWEVVREGQVGLLYRDGIFVREVAPGRHRVGPRGTLTLVTVLQQSMVVQSQECLSLDGFLPRLTALVELTVVNAHRAVSRQQDSYNTVIIRAVQVALRHLAAARTAEALGREPRDALDAELLTQVRQECEGIGVAIDAVRLRDIVLPSDLRRLITGVEKARREGQAALERAHSEQAALRALANAARLLKNNPELQNLRLLQAIGGAGAPTTLVLGTPAGIAPLQTGSEGVG